jgi:predicted metal-dependent phosphoesterase TrpH
VDSVLSEHGAGGWDVPVAAYLAAGKETLAAPAEGAAPPAPVPEYEPAPPVGGGGGRAGARRWLKGDLHIHTQHSDGRWSMDDVVRYAERNRLDFLATTDHNTTSAYDDVRWALERAGLPTIVIPAMELTTYWGHANALGVRDWIDWRVRGPEGLPRTIGDDEAALQTPTMESAAAEVHRHGGTFVVNHPRSAGYPACTGCRWEPGDASAQYADAVEVWNGAWDRPQNHLGLALWNRWLNAGRRLPATAGTDSHEWPHKPEQHGYTWGWARPDVEDILAAVREGRSFLSCGPRLTLDPAPVGYERVVALVGDAPEDAELRLVNNGRVAHTMRAAGVKEDELFVFPPMEMSGWYRVELWRSGSRMLLAVTNPKWA